MVRDRQSTWQELQPLTLLGLRIMSDVPKRVSAVELVHRIKSIGEDIVVDAEVLDEVENQYREIDWDGLKEAGFDKHGDYCFIYSYPPVRTLKPMRPNEIFEGSESEPSQDQLNLYLHIPYCSGICSYCYFAKVVDNASAPVDKDEYIELLIWEIADKLERYNPLAQFNTVHFGGGTPSILEPRQIERIMAFIRPLLADTSVEVTFECAPETIAHDPDKLKILLDSGVNRINVGVESLDDDVLRIMGRRHGADETRQSLDRVHEAGFDNTNVDLIYALPGQSLNSWIATMDEVVSLGIESISVYRLRQHPMKRITRLSSVHYPTYEDGLRMQIAHSVQAKRAGFVRVQSHKYAAASDKIQHQTERKRGVLSTQLLSAGCGSYGFMNASFYWNTKSLDEWAERTRRREHPVWIGQILSRDDLMRKSMVLGVHTSQGIDRPAFFSKFGVDPREFFADEINAACQLGLIEVSDDAIVPTELGYFFGDELSVSFYSPSIAAELADLDMKYGMFFEQDRYA